jgi:hypothetical protein
MRFSNARLFDTTSGSTYNRTNWERMDGTNPTSGNIFIPLAYGPILTMSSTIVVGATTYGLATPAHPMGTTSGGVTYAYQIVHDKTANGYTPQSLFGLEWNVGTAPANNTAFTVGADGAYTYNQVPTSIQQAIDVWRLAGTDVRAHQAQSVRLRFSLGVMYDRTAYPAQVNQAMDTALASWLSSLGINSVVQVSDALQVLHNVPGVDNIRFLNGSDYSGWNPATPNAFNVGIQQVDVNGTVIQSFVDTNGRAKDTVLNDAQVPVFNNSVYTQKSQNSWGTY